MVALPDLQSSPTIAAIYASYEARERQTRRRGYLGGSQIGRACSRELWYSFRWALRPEYEGRLLRLFQRGHREEPVLLDELRRVGIEVSENDPKTGRQWRFTAFGEHLSGGLDGVIRGLREAPRTWHLAEFKTHNTKSFKTLKKLGMKAAKPEHWGQMQLYMGLAGLKRGAYFAVCKETDMLHLERVEFDKAAYERLLERAEQIITSPEPLSRYSEDPFSPPCAFCDYLDLCHDGAIADMNCRTCAHSTPLLDGKQRWRCEFLGKDLSRQEQERGCDEHLYLPQLVPHSEAIDSGDGWVLYQVRKKDGSRFANVAATGIAPADVPQYGSRELRSMPPDAIGGEVLEKAREIFGEAS